MSPNAGYAAAVQPVRELPLDVVSEIRERGSEPLRVIVGRDSIWDVVGGTAGYEGAMRRAISLNEPA